MRAKPPADLHSFLTFQTHTVFRWMLSVPARFQEADWLKRPGGVQNHPHWLLGHLAVSSDFAPGVNHGASLVPAEWETHFAMGSAPHEDGVGYPSVSELAELLEQTYARNLKVVAAFDPAALAQPPGVEIQDSLKDFLRTQERWLSLQTLHLSYHTGQLQALAGALHPTTALR